MLAVFKRELRAYFSSPIGFVVIGLFVFLSAIFFAATNLLGASSEYNGLLSTMAFIFLFLVPILTMRLVTEEKRQHTDQMLITSPLSVTAIVIGKYLAAVAVFLITLLVTVLFPIMMSFFSLLGLEWWKILGGYIGLFLLGSAFIAVGLFFSSLTESQIVAAVATYTALLVMWIIDAVAGMVPTGWFAGLVFLAPRRCRHRAARLVHHPQPPGGHRRGDRPRWCRRRRDGAAAVAARGADREGAHLVLAAEALRRLQPRDPRPEPRGVLPLVQRRVRVPHRADDRPQAVDVREG